MLRQQLEVNKPEALVQVRCRSPRSPEDLFSCCFSTLSGLQRSWSPARVQSHLCRGHGVAESRPPQKHLGGVRGFPVPLLKLPLLLQMASTLVVADARISGIYTCMATNKVGTVERNVNFYITGKTHTQHLGRQPSDLSISSNLVCF